MWVSAREMEALRSDISDLKTSQSTRGIGELLERLELLERRFASLHSLLVTETTGGRPKLTLIGKQAQTKFMFGGPSPGFGGGGTPAMPTTPGP